jgi:enoyl-CoA hydratase/carnithine racemase
MNNAILQELREDGILILTINRPEAYNALNKAFFRYDGFYFG